MNVRNLIYSITCLSFSVIIGAAIYEHLVVVPKWSAAPPKSLAMFQGEYGLFPETFWKMIHPVTLLLFVTTLLTSWKSQRKFNILFAFAGYLCILLITAIYFVPELMAITTTPYSNEANAELTERAKMWELLSVIRLSVLIVLSIVFFLGLTRNDTKIAK